MGEGKKDVLAIEVGRKGLAPKNFDEQWRVASALCASKTLPTHYNTPEKVFAGMQVCAELGLPPITGMSKIYFVNGVPNLWGDMPLALCRQRGVLAEFLEYPIDENGKKICSDNGNLTADCFGYVCKARREGTNEVVEDSFTEKDAIRAGLIAKAGSLYKKFPKNMYKYKARALVLKNIGADVLSGIDIAEHNHHYNPDTAPERVLREVECQPSDFVSAEEKLRAAKDHNELMELYLDLTDAEKTHCRELSRELAEKFLAE